MEVSYPYCFVTNSKSMICIFPSPAAGLSESAIYQPAIVIDLSAMDGIGKAQQPIFL